MADLPPCGIGGQAVGGGPCTGTYRPDQAGQDAFNGISAGPVVNTLIAAAVILAGVIFVIWAVRRVAAFARGTGSATYVRGEPGTMEYDDKFWAAVGRSANARTPDADFGDMEADTEADTEDDVERLEYSPELVEEKQGADMTDEEYDAMEWREEYRREHEGDA